MATGIYACMLGTRSLASDIGDGSIAFLYAQPIRRSGIVTKKLLACLFNFSIFMLLLGAVSIGVGFLVCPWSTDLVQLASDIGTLVFGMYLTGLTFMALGFFLSSLLNSGRTAVPAALGAFFVTYVLGVVSKLRSEVDFLYYASPVEWFSPSRIYSKGILLEDVCLALGVMAVCILAAYLIYRRKDLQVS